MRSAVFSLFACSLLMGLPTGAAARDAVEYFPTPSLSAPISAAVRVGDVLYLSGQIGTREDGTLPDTVEEEAKLAMDKIAAVLKRAKLDMSHVFKCSVMLTDMATWESFNEVYAGYFKPGRMPARSAYGVKDLVLGAALEVECMAHAPEQ